MSPGSSDSSCRPTSRPAAACSTLRRGMVNPCCAYAYWIRPEQSYPVASEPPQRYGVPIAPTAVTTISAAADLPVAPQGADGGNGLPAAARRIASSSAGVGVGGGPGGGGGGGGGGGAGGR